MEEVRTGVAGAGTRAQNIVVAQNIVGAYIGVVAVNIVAVAYTAGVAASIAAVAEKTVAAVETGSLVAVRMPV